MGKQIYGLKRFYTSNEDLSQIRFREKVAVLSRNDVRRITAGVTIFPVSAPEALLKKRAGAGPGQAPAGGRAALGREPRRTAGRGPALNGGTHGERAVVSTGAMLQPRRSRTADGTTLRGSRGKARRKDFSGREVHRSEIFVSLSAQHKRGAPLLAQRG